VPTARLRAEAGEGPLGDAAAELFALDEQTGPSPVPIPVPDPQPDPAPIPEPDPKPAMDRSVLPLLRKR